MRHLNKRSSFKPLLRLNRITPTAVMEEGATTLIATEETRMSKFGATGLCVRGTNAVPGVSRDCARYEPVAWFNRNRIGRDLRGWYELPKELPSKLHALIRKLDPIECSEINRADKVIPQSVPRTFY
jgi:hypothetical protein